MGGHEWTEHGTAQPAAMLDGDEYSAQKCLISIAQLPGFKMEEHQQLPGMLRHQHA